MLSCVNIRRFVLFDVSRSNLKIEIKNENYSNDAINKALQRLLDERKKIATAYIDDKSNSKTKNELIVLFSKYNEEIIQLIGLYTF